VVACRTLKSVLNLGSQLASRWMPISFGVLLVELIVW
jgi:hypothetical protein